MKQVIKGTAAVLGDNINTDFLQPSEYFSLDRGRRIAGIASEVRVCASGVILMAGKNFGVGSSRESVIRGLKEAGVEAVIAESVSRIFYRNAVNAGLAVFEGLINNHRVVSGEKILLDTGKAVLISEGVKPLELRKPAEYFRLVLEAGGLLEYMEGECRH